MRVVTFYVKTTHVGRGFALAGCPHYVDGAVVIEDCGTVKLLTGEVCVGFLLELDVGETADFFGEVVFGEVDVDYTAEFGKDGTEFFLADAGCIVAAAVETAGIVVAAAGTHFFGGGGVGWERWRKGRGFCWVSWVGWERPTGVGGNALVRT